MLNLEAGFSWGDTDVGPKFVALAGWSRCGKGPDSNSGMVKAGIIKDPKVVKPAYENWIKDKVEWATISVAESYEESRKT